MLYCNVFKCLFFEVLQVRYLSTFIEKILATKDGNNQRYFLVIHLVNKTKRV